MEWGLRSASMTESRSCYAEDFTIHHRKKEEGYAEKETEWTR